MIESWLRHEFPCFVTTAQSLSETLYSFSQAFYGLEKITDNVVWLVGLPI